MLSARLLTKEQDVSAGGYSGEGVDVIEGWAYRDMFEVVGGSVDCGTSPVGG